jgi:soluble lytic murein transglycosylase-like protein
MHGIDDFINEASLRHGVPRTLLQAIITVESARNPWATRYEPHYRWLWDVFRKAPYRQADAVFPAPRGVSSATEKTAQKTSWGLMQIMGAVGRELGFDRPFLTELCDPQINLEYGCRHLCNYYRRFGGWEEATVAYNAGSPRKNKEGRWVNQIYLDRVLSAGWQP